MKGRFITLEGIDGAGKSTHLPILVEFLKHRGYSVLLTREPGGTPLGESLRELLLTRSMDSETETLLMFAARKEHLTQCILPAIEIGTWVVCDRFTDASFAYQGGGRGVALDKLTALEQWVHPDFQPDLTLLFDLPPALGKALRASGMTPLSALSMMVFVLLYIPCIATVTTIVREASWKWSVFNVVYTTGVAWCAAFVIFNAGRMAGIG